MKLPGKRIRRTRLVQGGRFVVALDVEMVIPDEDPSEPCYEPETVRLIRDVAEHAQQGDRDWLARHGKVYELLDASASH